MLVGTWGQMGKAGGRVLSSHQAAPLCLVLKGFLLAACSGAPQEATLTY